MIALWIAFGCLVALVVADRVSVYFTLLHHEESLRDLRRRELDTSMGLTEVERRLRIAEHAPWGDIDLVLDHLGLEIQEPATTPRRLVPKGKGGEE